MTTELMNNYQEVRARIAGAAVAAGRKPGDISLVAVSKYASSQAVDALVSMGHLDFGENRVQDGLVKVEAIANPHVRWHLIGRLQTNKIKYISPFFLVHSLDRWKLAVKLAEYARDKGIEFKCLVQVNVANDSAKAGMGIDEVEDFIHEVANLGGIGIRGLMTITALDAGREETLAWYKSMAAAYSKLRGQSLPRGVRMDWLSMGMSADYELAIAAGANLVRVGSAIFTVKGDRYADCRV